MSRVKDNHTQYFKEEVKDSICVIIFEFFLYLEPNYWAI